MDKKELRQDPIRERILLFLTYVENNRNACPAFTKPIPNFVVPSIESKCGIHPPVSKIVGGWGEFIATPNCPLFRENGGLEYC